MVMCLSVSVLMAEPVSKQIAFASDPVVTYSTTGKPAAAAAMVAKAGETVVADGSAVAVGTEVVFTAGGTLGYHVEWYVNEVKNDAEGFVLTLTINEDTKVEARYVENFKFIFKDTPYVKYADANGIIYMGPNFYCHKFEKLRAFGYTVDSFTGSNGKNYLVDNSPDSILIVKDTLKADVVMTPNYVLNESDFGDATVMPVWDFDKPDSVALFKNFQGKCCFVKPTWFDSNYIDLNMSCDATYGWIDN